MAFTRSCALLIGDIRDLEAALRLLKNIAKKEHATGNYTNSVQAQLAVVESITTDMLAT